MMGHRGGAQAAFDPASGAGAASPWDSGSAGGDLSRQAGLDDIGRGGGGGGGGADRGYGALDDSPGNDAQDDQSYDQDSDDLDDGDFDFDDGSSNDI
jgi:hypothetical protein